MYTISAILLICVILTACEQDTLQKPYKAKIVVTDESGYTFKEVEISSLTDISSVSGSYVELKGGAELDLQENLEEIVKSSDPENIYADKGEKLKINYIVENDIIVPKDFQSLAALTIYYNYETVFKFWEKYFELDVPTFGKLTIYNNPKLTINTGGVNATIETKVNAAFVPGTRDFWFFKKSKRAKIPLKMNLGVLAHEFSHAIFDDIFAERRVESYSTTSFISEKRLNAINEGVADYYAYMVTGRVTDFAFSFPSIANERQMPVSWTLSDISDPSRINLICQGDFYCFGSILASSLYEIASTLSTKYENSRVEVGKKLYEALSSASFKLTWETEKDSGNFLYSHLLVEILQLTPEADKNAYCSSFIKWFDMSEETTLLGANGCE